MALGTRPLERVPNNVSYGITYNMTPAEVPTVTTFMISSTKSSISNMYKKSQPVLVPNCTKDLTAAL